MQPPMTFEMCRALTQLTRQLLGAGERETHTHVLAEGQVYRVVVSLEKVPADQLHDVINRYL
ncbi:MULTISPECIES: hypothetical protein [Halomonas]|uniref:hypothetical protein n=1 Tax=Halomonas TaxID=2745 RepID=UPI001C93D7FB|nr:MULTISPECIES: hypothetical protein [Halomonas]MBY6207470.1 hypothetical protein [Halomonas sp. DP3Y7-2]MBY6228279.1 hypothetical protein [Halomonas sp. DP3Y7-1]MCA0916344.1 hypothetical protein [Halomonas denitrificans]